MSAQSQRFARSVLARFKELGLETDPEVARAGGPSSTTMTKIRATAHSASVDFPRPRGDSASRIDTAARWLPGSTRRLYDGGDPTPYELGEAADLAARIRASNLGADEKRVILERLGIA